jgi:hypothetical protein
MIQIPTTPRPKWSFRSRSGIKILWQTLCPYSFTQSLP